MTALVIYILAHPAAILALVAKVAGVTLWSAIVARRVPDRLTSWLHAWLGVQAAQIAVILALSAVSMLSRTAVWAALLTLLISGAGAYLAAGHRFRLPGARAVALALMLAVPLALWVARSTIIPDFTPDGQAYGSVRIGMWMNYRSVLVHMPTIMVNIFADEWNGELNGLLYAFATGNIQGAVMGNAEILIVATLAAVWTARRFGAGATGSALVGLLMATSPALVGLAAVTKGDLLACVGVLMAVGMLERPNAKAICLATVWFALAAGSKISVGLGAVIVLGFVFVPRIKLFIDKRAVGMLAASAAFSVLFVSRFATNAFIYHHPFMRVDAEAAEPGIDTLIGNMSVIGDRFVGFFPVSPNGLMFSTSLAAGLGVCGWLAAAGAATGRLKLPGMHATLAMLCAASVAVTAFLIPPRIWGFRYFLPFVGVLAIMGLVALTQAVDKLQALPRGAAILLVIAAAAFDFWMCFTPGDISSPHDFKTAMHYSVSTSPVMRPMLNFPQLLEESKPDALGLDSGERKKVAILNEIGAPILIFEGSWAQNRLYLAKDNDGLVSTAREHDVDYIVLARAIPGKREQFPVPGYRWISSGQNYDIAARQ